MNRNSPNRPPSKKWPAFRTGLGPLIRLVAFMWLLEIIDTVVLRHSLNALGIIPRTVHGLIGIPLAPLLHRDFYHLAANTAPLLIGGALILMHGTRTFRAVTVTVWVIGGVLEWMLAPSNICSIGASGVVFGYIGFLLAIAIVSFRPIPILTAAICAWFYGAAVLPNVLPTAESAARQISWHGHLFGLIAGIIAAKSNRNTTG